MANLFVTVEAGRGKWAYWRDKEKKTVVADEVCSKSASHFAGMLGQAVVTTPCDAELYADGFQEERAKSIWAREVESEQYANDD